MSEFTNRRAVNAIESHALQMGWFFRPQDVSDQGIDAHVEHVERVLQDGKAVAEVGTGRLIALQIKGGPSYFQRVSPNGWWFPFSAKKAQLWLGHALPVIVVLVDLEQDIVYWQRISSSTVQSTGAGFKVEVPHDQTMATADEAWRHFASGLEQLAEAKFEYTLPQLPPSVRRALEDRSQAERLDAALMASHLAEGRANARGTVQSLLATSPVWLQRNGSWAWAVIASYAAQYEHFDVSAEAFVRAAQSSADKRGAHLAAAALNLMEYDRNRSEKMLQEAEATGQAALIVAVGRSLLALSDNDSISTGAADPTLFEDSAEVRESSTVQGFLADRGMRAGDLDAALKHWKLRFAKDLESVLVMRQGADIYKLRWNTLRDAEDLHEASSLLERAIEQRRAWAGPLLDLTVELAQTYSLEGRFDSVLQLCLPAPLGSASRTVSEDARIRRFALFAADFLGRQDLVADLMQYLGDDITSKVLRLRLGVLRPSEDELAALWEEAFEQAVTSGDHAQSVMAAIELTRFNVDKRPALEQYVDRSVLPSSLDDLVGALLVAHNDLDLALPVLRTLALQDMLAAEQLIGRLREAGRHAQAAEACQALYAFGGNPFFLIRRASCLIDEGDDAAEASAAVAAYATDGYPIERGRLLTFLGARAADRGQWDRAEGYLAEVLKLFSVPDDAAVWRVVVSQLNQGKTSAAGKTLSKFRPSIRNREEAELWLQASSTVPWDAAKTSEALAIADRFQDPKLSTALLGHILTNTYGVDSEPGEPDHDKLLERRRLGQVAVPAELHKRAFAVMEKLAEEHGDETGIRVLRGDPADLISQVAELARGAAKADADMADLVKEVRNSNLPIGFIASLRGHGYATLLLQRTFGVLVSGSADEDEHTQEVMAARSAMGLSVIVDSASLLTLSGDPSIKKLGGQFASLQISALTMSDVHRAMFDVRGRAGSPGTLGWDVSASAPTYTELPADEFARQLRRAEALEILTQGLTVHVVTNSPLFGELGEDLQRTPWIHAIQLAHDLGMPLWSDDLGLRRVARLFGVSCFGTSALIDGIRDQALELSTSPAADDAAVAAAASANLRLALDHVVDIALADGDLIALAEGETWVPGAAVAALSRASWWAWQSDSFGQLEDLYARLRDENPLSLPTWQIAAMSGAARAARDPDASARVLAVIALLGFEPCPVLEEVTAGLRRAQEVANHIGVPDPALQVPSAASLLSRKGLCQDPVDFAKRVLAEMEISNEAQSR